MFSLEACVEEVAVVRSPSSWDGMGWDGMGRSGMLCGTYIGGFREYRNPTPHALSFRDQGSCN